MTEYKAIVTRSDPGWSIYVPEVDRHTYAAHLREIESMARDLVQVMTDLPIEDITMAVQLPADLADAIQQCTTLATVLRLQRPLRGQHSTRQRQPYVMSVRHCATLRWP
ncbi:hypothetical protein A5689_17885 [Mycobacterium intracellulare subsp. yongonense]|nr:hypothetical protein A5689_17885 [Mycobacterium intracellulare subsp. yongonense]